MAKPIALSFIAVLAGIAFNAKAQSKKLKYIAVGDSYTIGEGIKTENNWPTLLTKHLQWAGIDIELAANPSVTGYTTQKAITEELPVVKRIKPDFATVMLGVNDYVQGKNIEVFKQNLNKILDTLQLLLPNKQHIVMLTIPDYSVTPEGQKYVRGRNVTEDLKTWNKAIIKIAAEHSIPYVDLFDATRQMGQNKALVAADGLHPSEQEHQIWELLAFKACYDVLNKQE